MPSTDPLLPQTPTGELDRAVQGLKIPPHSVEAEQSVLGALLLDNNSWDLVAPILGEIDFYRTEHSVIFRSIGKLVNENKPADVLTVHEELKSTGLGENYGITYLNQLSSNTPSSANVRGYAQIIRDRSILRRLIQTADSIANSAFDPEGKAVRTLLDEAESRILAIGEIGGSTREFFEMEELMTEAVVRIQELQARGGSNEITGVATGFIDLDKKTSGLQKGDLIIVAGRPSMGKAQPLDAQVKTWSGWKQMQDLMVGDALASIDGQASFVTGIFPQGLKEIYEVVFSDGRATQCCAEHLWRISHPDWSAAKVLSTAEIANSFAQDIQPSQLSIDAITGDFGATKSLPMDPWLLGALLGCIETVDAGEITFKELNEAFLEKLQTELTQEFQEIVTTFAIVKTSLGQLRWRRVLPSKLLVNGASFVSPCPINEAFSQVGLKLDSFTPSIPSDYLLAKKQVRIALLQGLIAGFASNQTGSPGHQSLSELSESFAAEITSLVRSLGGTCKLTIQAKDNSSLGYNLEIDLPVDGHAPVVTFAKIQSVRRAQAQCISVSHPSKTYLTDDYVVTHNTSFAMNIAEHVAIKEGLPVLVFSMEMGASQLATRMLGSVGRVNQGRLKTGNLNDEEWGRFTNAIGLLNKAPMLIDETGSLSSLELRARARRMARKYGKVGLVVIDYLQLMAGKGGTSGDNRTTEISEISRSLKSLAKEMGCPVIALSQLNRSLENRENKRPIMSDLRECVSGNTQVILADGTTRLIKELVGSTPTVIAMDEQQQLQSAVSDCVWSVGVKPVLRIQTQSGLTLTATQNHRIYTQKGWQTVADLTSGDAVAIAKQPLQSEMHTNSFGISWDPILTIEDAGEEEVFDLTVPSHGSWLAGGIVSHNSGAIEQDADVIIFIYRDSVYHPETDRPGIAEVIIGKQRNGPIGVVELSWQGEFTKFDNLAHGYQSNPFTGNSGGSSSNNVPF
jgi:replicative DNA helicase